MHTSALNSGAESDAAALVDHEFADRIVELFEGKESAVPQARVDPPLNDEHTDLDLGYVARLARTHANDRRAVVLIPSLATLFANVAGSLALAAFLRGLATSTLGFALPGGGFAGLLGCLLSRRLDGPAPPSGVLARRT